MGNAPIPPAKKYLVDHTIVRGDSLWKIANDYDTTIKEIMAANEMENDQIIAGKTIKVPTNQPPAGAEEAAGGEAAAETDAPGDLPAVVPSITE